LNQRRGKHSILKKKRDILDMWIPVRKHVTLAAKLGVALSSLNTVVKYKKDSEKGIHKMCQVLCSKAEPERATFSRPERFASHVL
jgi:regulator of sigma D